MTMIRVLTLTAVAALLAAAPAAAQQTDLKSLPSGSLMLKEMPAAQGNLQNLPGVNLNMRAQGASATNCSERQVTSLGVGDLRGGTVSECSFGNFSFSTVKPNSAGGNPPYWVEGVPSPFGSNGGPPPGSGGFAPRQGGFW